jgi:hypothetical protein
MRFAWATRLSFKLRFAPGLAAWALFALLATGCQYGYSRSALETDTRVAPPPRGYVSAGYPWYLSFSYTYGYPSSYYAPYWYSPYAPFYDPWWYYPPRYAYPYYPYYYSPFVVRPAPRRTFRSNTGPSVPAPSPSTPSPSGRSRRQFNLP